ncbi:unnamed protein product [Pylaiella littoralis]
MHPPASLPWTTAAESTKRKPFFASTPAIPAAPSQRTRTTTTRAAPPPPPPPLPPSLKATATALLVMCNALVLLVCTPAAAAAGKTGGGLSLSVDHAPCVRLFHSGGDVGCRTPGRKGVAGPLLLVDSERVLQDIEALVLPTVRDEAQRGHKRKGVSGEAVEFVQGMEDGLIAILAEGYFNGTILERLSATGLLGGVMVLAEAGTVDSGVGVDERRRLSLSSSSSSSSSPLPSSSARPALTGGGEDSVSNPDVKTPQGKSTPSAAFDIDASYPWNSHGDGMLMEAFDFPVVLVTGGSADEVRARAASNGNLDGSSWEYPLHKGRMNFYFGGSDADLNSQECLGWTDINGDRSPQCKPLGGQSTWASVGGPGMGSKDTVFAVAGMDSTSMFHGRAPGEIFAETLTYIRRANSAVSGLVALLSAAESLGAIGRSGGVDFSALPRQIVFAAFQAEAYGFTGSRRFVQDWRIKGVSCQNGVGPSVSPTGMEACLDPLYPSLEFQKLGRPAHVISVDQASVGCLPESTLWLHPSAGASTEDQGTLSRLSPSGGVILLSNSTETELPPSPLTAFVKAHSQQSGFVLSGYDKSFSCPHYHSRLETRATITASSVTAAAEVLAMSTLLLAGGTEAEAKTLEVNATLVETLLDCLLEDWSCDTVKEYVVGELANLEEVLGFRVSVEAPFPPTMYAGPLEFRSGGGMPTVRHTNGDGSWRLYPSWTGTFDPDHEKIQLVPNLVEMFCRAFLSEQAASAHAARYGEHECRSSGDCPTLGECQYQSWGEGGGGGGVGGAGGVRAAKHDRSVDRSRDRSVSARRSGSDSMSDSVAVPRPECVRGRCGCPSGFHHIALGVGLEREDQLDQYGVVESAVEQGAPLWTEPNWRNIGVEVYLDPGSAVGTVAVGVGVAVTAAAGVASWLLLRSLEKRKLM